MASVGTASERPVPNPDDRNPVQKFQEDWTWSADDPFALQNASNPATIALSALGIDVDDIPKILARAGMILLGVMLFLIGVAMVMSGTRTAALVGDAAKTAADFIPAGKAAKVIKKVL